MRIVNLYTYNKKFTLKIITFFIPFLFCSLSTISLSSCFTQNIAKEKQYSQSNIISFDKSRALNDVLYQVQLGPRTPETKGHESIINWLSSSLIYSGWSTEIQIGEVQGYQVKNVIGRWGSGKPLILLGAHYDTRIYADNDPNPLNRNKPVPGANDGASGVAVLLELSRIIPDFYSSEIHMVFFDAEDNGNIFDRDWLLGSRYYADNLTKKPDAMILIDMVGDDDLKLYMEKNSDFKLTEDIWEQAAALGYNNYFIPSYKYRMIDDHLPFIAKGIPAVDIIDFDYPYWHTVSDTFDKISGESLKIVGDTLLSWLLLIEN